MHDYVTKGQFEGAVATIRQDIRDVISHVREALAKHEESNNHRFDAIDQRFEGIDQRFEGMDQRFEVVDTKLDAIMESAVTRHEFKCLIAVLKKQSIKIDESKIF